MVALVNPSDLEGFPGAPFTAGVLAAAEGQVRDACGWHIAPVVSETVTVQGGGKVALLPSLFVAEVTSVTDEDDVVLDGWSFRPNGVLKRSTAFPETFKVTFTHGYDACPPSLFPAVAERAQSIRTGGRVKQESLSGRSVSLDLSSGEVAGALAKYTLPGRP